MAILVWASMYTACCTLLAPYPHTYIRTYSGQYIFQKSYRRGQACFFSPDSASGSSRRNGRHYPLEESSQRRMLHISSHAIIESHSLHKAHVNKNTVESIYKKGSISLVSLEETSTRRRQRKEILDRHNATPFLPGKGFVRIDLCR